MALRKKERASATIGPHSSPLMYKRRATARHCGLRNSPRRAGLRLPGAGLAVPASAGGYLFDAMPSSSRRRAGSSASAGHELPRHTSAGQRRDTTGCAAHLVVLDFGLPAPGWLRWPVPAVTSSTRCRSSSRRRAGSSASAGTMDFLVFFVF